MDIWSTADHQEGRKVFLRCLPDQFDQSSDELKGQGESLQHYPLALGPI